MKVPFLDLKAQYQTLRPEIDEAIQETINNCAFVLGKNTEDFETNFANYCNTKYAIGCSSGTAALHLALLALNIKPGDEIITTPSTFFATAEAICHVGAKPIFVDIKEDTYNIDPNEIEEAITNKTKAILPVHLYGNPADMDHINEIAQKHNLKVIEDSCQAHGALYKNKRAGSMSDIAAFSFYPGKNLGAYGESGGITTNNEQLAETCKLLRAHGEFPKNTHNRVGYNYRMQGIQAAVLNIKLKHLDSWNQARNEKAKLYNDLLSNTVTTPTIPETNQSVFHLYVIQHNNRFKLREFLTNNEIATGIHYERPVHLQQAFSNLGYKEGSLPIAEKVNKHILSLPIYPELTEEQIHFVCEKIKEFKND